MEQIMEWKARRAGGSITINGVDKASGEPRKIVGVDEIYSPTDSHHPIAVDKHGARYELV